MSECKKQVGRPKKNSDRDARQFPIPGVIRAIRQIRGQTLASHKTREGDTELVESHERKAENPPVEPSHREMFAACAIETQ